jgi:hypothetical protein
MTQWVCFDETAADAARAAGADVRQRSGNPLIAALREPGNSVVILPGANPQELAIVSIIKREAPRKAAAPVVEFVKPTSSRTTATGFLGLTDEPEFADEVEKKPWWKKW